jgi:hypothetical protein
VPLGTGKFHATFVVTDDGTPSLSDREDVVITIGTPNQVPTLTPIGPQSIEAGTSALVPLAASDSDGDALTFAAIDLPAGAILVGPGDGTATISWSPTGDQLGGTR